jgi:hypothetical protein
LCDDPVRRIRHAKVHLTRDAAEEDLGQILLQASMARLHAFKTFTDVQRVEKWFQDNHFSDLLIKDDMNPYEFCFALNTLTLDTVKSLYHALQDDDTEYGWVGGHLHGQILPIEIRTEVEESNYMLTVLLSRDFTECKSTSSTPPRCATSLQIWSNPQADKLLDFCGRLRLWCQQFLMKTAKEASWGSMTLTDKGISSIIKNTSCGVYEYVENVHTTKELLIKCQRIMHDCRGSEFADIFIAHIQHSKVASRKRPREEAQPPAVLVNPPPKPMRSRNGGAAAANAHNVTTLTDASSSSSSSDEDDE